MVSYISLELDRRIRGKTLSIQEDKEARGSFYFFDLPYHFLFDVDLYWALGFELYIDIRYRLYI